MLVDRLPKSALLMSHAIVAVVILFAAVATSQDTPNDEALDTYATDVLDPPKSLTASSGPAIELTWTATPDPYAMGYRVYRRTVTGGDYTLLATVALRTSTTYVDAAPADLNHYVVKAYYRDVESGSSNEVVGTTRLSAR